MPPDDAQNGQLGGQRARHAATLAILWRRRVSPLQRYVQFDGAAGALHSTNAIVVGWPAAAELSRVERESCFRATSRASSTSGGHVSGADQVSLRTWGAD